MRCNHYRDLRSVFMLRKKAIGLQLPYFLCVGSKLFGDVFFRKQVLLDGCNFISVVAASFFVDQASQPPQVVN